MKLQCKHCQKENEPKVDGKSLTCKHCKEPFNYFQHTMYFNEINKQRLAKERAANNKKVTRSYRLK